MLNKMRDLVGKLISMSNEKVVEDFDNVKSFKELCATYKKLDSANSGDMDIDIQKRKLTMLEIDSIIRAEKKARGMDTHSERERETAVKWKWLMKAEDLVEGIKVELDKEVKLSPKEIEMQNKLDKISDNLNKRFVNDLW